MKVLVVNGISALRGGGQTNLINLMNSLPSYQCKVVFILNSSNFALFSKFKSNSIDLFEAKFASRSIFHRVAWERFILPIKLREWSADVYYTPGGVMTTKVSDNCVTVTTLQNMLPFEISERKKFPLFSYLRIKLFLLKFVFLKSYRLADKIIFISKYSQDVVRKIIPKIIEKSVVIPLGINDIFVNNGCKYDLPCGLDNGKFYLYVSHMDYYKSQKELIYSWKKLIDQGFEYPLVFAGPIVNQYGKEVLSLIEHMGLSSNVIHLGHVEYDKLPGLYQASRALIFASTCECCPNILLEMLASERVILCSNKGPMPEFGEDGVIYFDPYSIDQLTQKVLQIESGIIDKESIAQRAKVLSKQYEHDKTIEKTIKYILN